MEKKQVCDTLMKLKMNNFLEGDLMVSEKMYELGTKKSTIRTIFEYGRKRALEVGEENIYDFSIGNPNVPAPDFVKTGYH